MSKQPRKQPRKQPSKEQYSEGMVKKGGLNTEPTSDRPKIEIVGTEQGATQDSAPSSETVEPNTQQTGQNESTSSSDAAKE